MGSPWPLERQIAFVREKGVRARCTACRGEFRIKTSSEDGKRLRDTPSPCCKARLRAPSWKGWTDAWHQRSV